MERLIVIGASTGGVAALLQLASKLPSDIAAPVLVVLHVGEHASILPYLMSRNSQLDIEHAAHGERLVPGTVRVAPPDRHMMVSDGVIQLNRGAKEHHTRPAIDPLFRSAALSHGAGTVGVVLTGALDDGTAGLQAIKHCGGIAVVQDPADAIEPSMPQSALKHVEVDHCVPLATLPLLLASLAARAPAPAVTAPPQDLLHEQALTLNEGDPMKHLSALGSTTPFVCPDCHGGLWKLLDSRPERYRCHTGHAFTARTLQQTLATAGEEASWNALRALQERSIFLHYLAQQRRSEGDDAKAETLEDASRRLADQATLLRQLLEDSPQPID